MSATYTQWCKTHGEWDMDIDNPSECPECIRLGLTEVQQLKRRIEAMKQTLDDKTMEITNLKEEVARLLEDRDQILSEYNKLGGSH